MERERTIPEGEVLNAKFVLLGVCVDVVGEKAGESMDMSSFGHEGDIGEGRILDMEVVVDGGEGCCVCWGRMGLKVCAAGLVAALTFLSIGLSLLLFLSEEVEMVRFLEGFGTVELSLETEVVVAIVVVDDDLRVLGRVDSFDDNLEVIEAPLEVDLVLGTTTTVVVVTEVVFVQDNGAVLLGFFDLATGAITDFEIGEGRVFVLQIAVVVMAFFEVQDTLVGFCTVLSEAVSDIAITVRVGVVVLVGVAVVGLDLDSGAEDLILMARLEISTDILFLFVTKGGVVVHFDAAGTTGLSGPVLTAGALAYLRSDKEDIDLKTRLATTSVGSASLPVTVVEPVEEES